MPEFLELLPPQQALDLFIRSLPASTLTAEKIALGDALHRINLHPILAPEALPPFNRSTVDGYAVRARDTFGANEALPAYLNLVGEAVMGGQPDFIVGSGQAATIHTGGMLPDGSDAVIMMEHTQLARPGELEILKSVAPGENLLFRGEDAMPGDVILPPGQLLGPAEIGGLSASGILEVEVAARPRVGILSTGDEIVPPNQSPAPGQVRDVNSYSMAALIQQQGGIPVAYGIVPDQEDMLLDRLKTALEDCDLVVITAGSSASTRDLTASAIGRAGNPGVIVHGVNIRPGKPTILAVCNGEPVIGLPGNPVSALVVARLFVVPVLRKLQGLPAQRLSPSIRAELSINLSSQAGREDWIPVRLIQTGAKLRAEPVFYKSNNILSLVRANGLVRIPPDANGLESGIEVEVFPI